MKNIFVIQTQEEGSDFWDLTGEAFLSEEKASHRVDVLISQCLEKIHDREDLIHMVQDSSLPEDRKTWFTGLAREGSNSLSPLLLTLNEEYSWFLLHLVDQTGEGDLYSYETVGLVDLEENQDG